MRSDAIDVENCARQRRASDVALPYDRRRWARKSRVQTPWWRMFERSLSIRHLNCGSCNGCEHEMNAVSNAFYDITRDGWDIVASPRHADVITVTGPMTEAMRSASRETIDAVPRPFIVLGIGDCAAGKGPWAGASAAGGGAAIELAGDIVVRGCPPTPDDIRAGLKAAASRLSRRADAAAAPVGGPLEIREPRSAATLWEERSSTVPGHVDDD